MSTSELVDAALGLGYIFVQLPNFKKTTVELETVEDQWLYVLNHAFASSKEIEIKNDAVIEALERIKVEVEDKEEPPMITKKERECTIASIEHWAELRGEATGEARERKRSATTIARLEEEIRALKAALAAAKA